ncbi:MAG: hypothetical protein E6Q50_06035 [Lysobacter sp.]|nr:MAG: hypothetical protein E6Q50_06035 [Lysobacter sp.]
MSQNLLSLQFSDQQLAAIDAALTSLESALAGLIALTPDQRRAMTKMGPKSEAFCRQTLTVLSQNPQVIPPSVNLAEAQADLAALDALRPRLARLERLTERAGDTDAALGGDVMSFALEGYALLKFAGKNQGLEGLRKELSARFARSSGKAEGTPAPGG